ELMAATDRFAAVGPDLPEMAFWLGIMTSASLSRDGRLDEARAQIAALRMPDEFLSSEGVGSSLLAEVAAELGGSALAARVYPMLSPFGHRGMGWGLWG